MISCTFIASVFDSFQIGIFLYIYIFRAFFFLRHCIVMVFRIVGLKFQTEVCLASILAATIYQTMQPEDLHIVQIYLYVDTVQ